MVSQDKISNVKHVNMKLKPSRTWSNTYHKTIELKTWSFQMSNVWQRIFMAQKSKEAPGSRPRSLKKETLLLQIEQATVLYVLPLYVLQTKLWFKMFDYIICRNNTAWFPKTELPKSFSMSHMWIRIWKLQELGETLIIWTCDKVFSWHRNLEKHLGADHGAMKKLFCCK